MPSSRVYLNLVQIMGIEVVTIISDGDLVSLSALLVVLIVIDGTTLITSLLVGIFVDIVLAHDEGGSGCALPGFEGGNH
jgi:hypothetical protein